MRKRVIKHYDRVVVLLLAMFGLLPGCQNDLVMYGQPSADYRVSGVVTDANNKPIQHIQVVRPRKWENDTAYTDSRGRFDFGEINGFPVEEITVFFEDIDGEEHGGYFAKREVTEEVIEAERVKKASKNGWYEGAFWKQLHVVLNKSNNPAPKDVPPTHTEQ